MTLDLDFIFNPPPLTKKQKEMLENMKNKSLNNVLKKTFASNDNSNKLYRSVGSLKVPSSLNNKNNLISSHKFKNNEKNNENLENNFIIEENKRNLFDSRLNLDSSPSHFSNSCIDSFSFKDFLDDSEEFDDEIIIKIKNKKNEKNEKNEKIEKNEKNENLKLGSYHLSPSFTTIENFSDLVFK